MTIQPVSNTPLQPTARTTQVAPVRRETPPEDGPSPAEQVVQAAQQTPPREQIDRAMNEVRRVLAPVARNLQFSIDEETGRTVIKVMDASTQEVIRQIPSEELLAITRSLDSFSGLFVKQKA
jgi:flagellar protein FlaG